MQTLTTLEFAKLHPTMWEALPDAYANDSVLEFWQVDNVWHCRPLESERAICGDWTAIFHKHWEWSLIFTKQTNTPPPTVVVHSEEPEPEFPPNFFPIIFY